MYTYIYIYVFKHVGTPLPSFGGDTSFFFRYLYIQCYNVYIYIQIYTVLQCIYTKVYIYSMFIYVEQTIYIYIYTYVYIYVYHVLRFPGVKTMGIPPTQQPNKNTNPGPRGPTLSSIRAISGSFSRFEAVSFHKAVWREANPGPTPNPNIVEKQT